MSQYKFTSREIDFKLANKILVEGGVRYWPHKLDL